MFNKIDLMQVRRGNILKTIGMLCNPNFVNKNNRCFGLSPIYFLYPLTSLPKMVNLRNACFHQAEPTLCFSDQVLVLLCLPRSIKGECLLSCKRERENAEMKTQRKAVCSEASLTLEIFGDPRTTNTRHR